MIPQIRNLPQPLKDEVREAFIESLRLIWNAMAGICGLGLLSTFLMEGLPLHSVVDEEWTLKQREGSVDKQENDIEDTAAWSLQQLERLAEKQAETTERAEQTDATVNAKGVKAAGEEVQVDEVQAEKAAEKPETAEVAKTKEADEEGYLAEDVGAVKEGAAEKPDIVTEETAKATASLGTGGDRCSIHV